MEPILDHTAIAEVLILKLRTTSVPYAKFLAASVPQTLVDNVKEESKTYRTIIDHKKNTWFYAIEHLRFIFKWGYNLGRLIKLLEENPMELPKIYPDLIASTDSMKGIIPSSQTMRDVIKMVGRNLVPEDIVLFPGVILSQFIQIHSIPNMVSFGEYQKQIGKSTAYTILEKVHKAFIDLPLAKDDVIKMVTFWVFNISVGIMFGNGLQCGIDNFTKPQQEKSIMEEQIEITKSFGKIFTELEEMLRQK